MSRRTFSTPDGTHPGNADVHGVEAVVAVSMHLIQDSATGELPRRVAILRALKLGDLLCAVPAFRALRAALPEADLRLVGLPWSRLLVERFDRYLDGFFELPGFPGFPERPFEVHAFPDFLARVHAWGPDLVLQLHGSGELANPLAVMLGGRMTAGFFLPGAYCPDPARFVPYPDDEPEVRRHLRVLERLGIPIQGDHKELPLRAADHLALAALPGAADLSPGGYVCVHPGASVPERRWPAERFARVADVLADAGLRVVLTGGAEEREVTAAVARAMLAPALDLTGLTDLGSLGALLQRARLLVSNDTGVVHVAEGVGTSSVIISFMAGKEVLRWAPLDRARHQYLAGGDAVGVDQVLRATRTAGLLDGA